MLLRAARGSGRIAIRDRSDRARAAEFVARHQRPVDRHQPAHHRVGPAGDRAGGETLERADIEGAEAAQDSVAVVGDRPGREGLKDGAEVGGNEAARIAPEPTCTSPDA